MSKPHPSFGIVPEAKFREAEQASAGRATEILRQYDPLFGRVKAGDRVSKYRLKCSQRVMIRQFCTVELEASGKEQAEELVSKLPDTSFNWDDDGTDADYADDFEVEEIEEISS
jgi:hypothetical protein